MRRTLLSSAFVVACVTASDDPLTQWQNARGDEPPLPEPFMPPLTASEWYTVTIADTPVGYMHTIVEADDAQTRTIEVMDVQVLLYAHRALLFRRALLLTSTDSRRAFARHHPPPTRLH
jgi:hypothetical protein